MNKIYKGIPILDIDPPPKVGDIIVVEERDKDDNILLISIVKVDKILNDGNTINTVLFISTDHKGDIHRLVFRSDK